MVMESGSLASIQVSSANVARRVSGWVGKSAVYTVYRRLPWGYRSLNWEAGSVFSTNPKEAVPKIGLEDKIVGAGKYMFEREQKARVPNPIELLSDIEKDTPAILPSLKGGGNGVNNSEALLDSRVRSEVLSSERGWIGVVLA